MISDAVAVFVWLAVFALLRWGWRQEKQAKS